MAIAYDKSTARQDIGNPGTSSSNFSFGSLPVAGGAVVVFVGGGDYTAANTNFLSSVTDNQSNSYTLYGTNIASGGYAAAYIAVALNVNSSGTFTITLNYTNSTDLYLVAGASSFTGIATSSALDQQTSANAGSSSTSVGGNFTTTNADDLLLYSVAAQGAADQNMVDDTGWTNLFLQDDSVNYSGMLGSYKIESSSGLKTASADFDACNSASFVMISLKASTGGDVSTALSGSASTGGHGTATPVFEIGL